MNRIFKVIFIISLLLNVFFVAFAYKYISTRNISYNSLIYRVKSILSPPSRQNYMKEPIEQRSGHNFCDASYNEINDYLLAEDLNIYKQMQEEWIYNVETGENFKEISSNQRDEFKKFLCLDKPFKIDFSHKEKTILNNALNEISLISIDYLPGINVYGLLMLPKKGKPPYPAVVVLHGYGGSPEYIAGFKNDYHSEIGKKLVEHGYAVFAPYFVHGEKQFTKRRNILHGKALLIGRNFEGIEIGKIIRAVDFLQKLPEIDKEKIAVYGISMGGEYSLYASAVDERLKVAVVSGFFNDRFKKMVVPSNKYTAYIFSDEFNCFHFNQFKVFSDAKLASLIAPRPLFIEQGLEDPYVNIDAAKDEFQKAKKVYKKLGMEDKIKFGAFGGIHQIYAWDAIKFLDKFLK